MFLPYDATTSSVRSIQKTVCIGPGTVFILALLNIASQLVLYFMFWLCLSGQPFQDQVPGGILLLKR